MSVPSGDYSGGSSNGQACSYGELSHYNDGYSMGVPFQGKVISGNYIVPQYAPISYDSLAPKIPSCSGYGNIESAYGGPSAASCNTTYRSSACGSRK